MTCIYCGGQGRKTKEHIIPAGLGGTTTLDDAVCHDCNTGRFSKVDGKLIEHIRMVWLPLRGIHHPQTLERKFLTNRYITRERRWLTTRTDRAGDAITMHQLVLDQNLAAPAFFGDDDSDKGAALRSFLEELADENAHLEPWVVEDDHDNPPVDPAYIRTAPGRFILRAKSGSLAEALQRRAASGARSLLAAPTEPATLGTYHEGGFMRVEMDFPAWHRAVAKMGLNALCALYGTDAVMLGQFMAIRDFALRGGRPRRKFVDFDLSESGKRIAVEWHHVVDVSHVDGHAVADVRIYGRPFARVHLSRSKVAPVARQSRRHVERIKPDPLLSMQP